MYKAIDFHIRGIVPTLMHNSRLADPLDEITIAIKVITAKGKKKTPADLEELARLEWNGSLYLEDGKPCWPGINIEGLIRQAAMKERKGKDVLAGIIVDGNSPVIYEGPKDIVSLWKDSRFRDTSPAKIQGKMVMRTRPIFHKWELKFTVSYLEEVVDQASISRWVHCGGMLIGLSDWRPRYGRYEVLS